MNHKIRVRISILILFLLGAFLTANLWAVVPDAGFFESITLTDSQKEHVKYKLWKYKNGNEDEVYIRLFLPIWTVRENVSENDQELIKKEQDDNKYKKKNYFYIKIKDLKIKNPLSDNNTLEKLTSDDFKNPPQTLTLYRDFIINNNNGPYSVTLINKEIIKEWYLKGEIERVLYQLEYSQPKNEKFLKFRFEGEKDPNSYKHIFYSSQTMDELNQMLKPNGIVLKNEVNGSLDKRTYTNVKLKEDDNFVFEYVFFTVYCPKASIPDVKANDTGIAINENKNKIALSRIKTVHNNLFKEYRNGANKWPKDVNPFTEKQDKDDQINTEVSIGFLKIAEDYEKARKAMNNVSADQVAYALGLPKVASFKKDQNTYELIEKPFDFNSDDKPASEGELTELETKSNEWGYEWLHLIARSYGNPNTYIPENLVLGTNAANTRMMIFEDVVRRLARNYNYKVMVEAKFTYFDIMSKESAIIYPRWLVKNIEYTVIVIKTNSNDIKVAVPELGFSVNINPFQTARPSFAEDILFIKYMDKIADGLKSQEVQKPSFNFKKETLLAQLQSLLNSPSLELTKAGADYIKGSWDHAQLISFTANNLSSAQRDATVLTAFHDPAVIQKHIRFNPLLAAPNIQLKIKPPSGSSLGSIEDISPPSNEWLCSGNDTAQMVEYDADNFVMTQIFTDLDCDAVEQFVFDDVSIDYDKDPAGISNNLLFRGKLRMHTGTMATIGSFLSTGDSLQMGAKINIGTQNFSSTIAPQSLVLYSEMEFNLPLTEDITLKKAALQITILRKMDNLTGTSDWKIMPFITGSLEVRGLSTEPMQLDCLIFYSNGTLHISAMCKKADGLFGMQNLTLENFRVNFDIGKEKNIDVSAFINTGLRTYGLGGKISNNGMGLFVSVSNFTLYNLYDMFAVINDQVFNPPEFDIQFNDVLIGFATRSCYIGSVYLEEGLTLGCSITVNGYTATGKLVVSSTKIAFLGDLAGKFELGPVCIERAFIDLKFFAGMGAEFTIGGRATIALGGGIAVQSIEVDCSVKFEKYNDTFNMVVYAAFTGEEFRLSTIFPATEGSFLDAFSFSKVVIVFATADCTTQNADYQFTVKQGLSLMGVMQEIPVISQLTGSTQVGMQFCAHFGPTTDIAIRFPEEIALNLGPMIECEPFQVRIGILPQPTFSLEFGMKLKLPGQDEPLEFDMSLGFGLLEAWAWCTATGYWEDPFGLKGLKIGPKLAFELRINYAQFLATGTPSKIAFLGSMMLGDIEIEMAFSISTDPTQQILMGSVAKLTPQNLVKFANTVCNIDIPVGEIPNFFKFNDVTFYCAPLGGSIGNVYFEPGISFHADLVLFGKHIAVYTRLAPNGFVANGHLDKIEIGPLAITGKQGEDAEFDIQLTTTKQSIFIDGQIELWDSYIGIYADISISGVAFEFDMDFINALTVTIRAESRGSLVEPETLDFIFYADFQSSLMQVLKTEVAAGLLACIDDVKESIDTARGALEEARKKYNVLFDKLEADLLSTKPVAEAFLAGLEQELAKMQKYYEGLINGAIAGVTKAKQALEAAIQVAQNMLSDARAAYYAVLKVAQALVSQAQRDLDTAIRSAQNALNAAQNYYNKLIDNLEDKVDDAKREIDRLKDKIKSKKKKLKKVPWWNVVKKAAIAAEILFLEGLKATAIATRAALKIVLSTARVTGNAAIAVAQGTLETIRKAKTKALNIVYATLEEVRTGDEYDFWQWTIDKLEVVKKGPLQKAWQGAVNTLAVYRDEGSKVIGEINNQIINIGEFAVWAAYEAARIAFETIENTVEFTAFTSAELFLTGLEIGATAVLTFAAAVAEHIGDFIDVRRVTLSSSLKKALNGELFTAYLDFTLLGQSRSLTINCDLRDPIGFIQSLILSLLNMATGQENGPGLDRTPPNLAIPQDIVVEATAVNMVVNIGQATATDEASVMVTNDAPKTFTIGTVTITWKAVDINANIVRKSQRITVVDTTLPSLDIPKDITVEAKALNSQLDVGSAAASDIFPVTITSDIPDTYSLGETVVIWTATDANGNIIQKKQKIIVVDTTAPELSIPEDMTIEATAVNSLIDSGLAQVNDIFPVTLSNDKPELFSIGETVINWTAEDSNGNKTQKTQVITVVDTTPPELIVSENVEIEATGFYTTVDTEDARAVDIFDVTVTSDKPDTFSLGQTIINWVAVDANGNMSQKNQVITVQDTTAPRLTVPEDIVMEAKALGTAVNIGQAEAIDIFDVILINNEPELYTLGNTDVIWTATDLHGNITQKVQKITVVDTTAPVLTIPGDVTVEANAVNTRVNIGIAKATDIYKVKITNDAPAIFPLGTTTVTWKAKDQNGNITTETQCITVRDTTPPQMIIPAHIMVEASDILTPVEIDMPAVKDIYAVVITRDAPEDGFPIGETEVVWRATDSSGNTRTGTQKVTVVDTTAPELTVPADITVEAAGEYTQLNLETAAATDIFPVSIEHDGPASYALGTITVTWTAIDENGNESTGKQNVTVVDTLAPEVLIEVEPAVLQPADHKMVDVKVRVKANDLVDPDPEVILYAITSNESDGTIETGSGNIRDDIQDAILVIEDYEFKLRALKAEDGKQRVYTLIYKVTDFNGNSILAKAEVKVLHDLKKR